MTNHSAITCGHPSGPFEATSITRSESRNSATSASLSLIWSRLLAIATALVVRVELQMLRSSCGHDLVLARVDRVRAPREPSVEHVVVVARPGLAGLARREL